MVGKSLVNQQGEQLGKIERIVRSRQDQSLMAVVSSGGIFGIGGKQVVLPLNQLQLQGDQAVAQMPLTQEELQQMAEYQPDQYEDVQPQQAAQDQQQGGASGQAGQQAQQAAEQAQQAGQEAQQAGQAAEQAGQQAGQAAEQAGQQAQQAAQDQSQGAQQQSPQG
jgi:hypothetical protein